MCGICGAVSLRGAPIEEATLEGMTTWLRADRTAGLGNTRLAIIDLSADGHQPMSDAAARRWIAYNGEVYNFGTLRAELEGRGYAFRSRTDTEVILSLYVERGAECLQALRGMFALAIWDDAERRLFLARDRLGKKPLYYYQDADWLIFGSEIKAILAHPAAQASKRMNMAALPAYLAYGYVPTPDTLFENIHSLPPGCYLSARDGKIAIEKYWEVPLPISNYQFPLTADEWAEAVLDKLREAVRLRLVADVPLGAFLSGGLDSSAVVALMAEAGPVKTYAIGFSDEPSYDERPHARRVVRYLGCEHHEFVVQAQSVDLAPKLVWHHDQPFGDSSAIPSYLMAKCAREHVTVALTGDGGDELFAGYDRFRAARLAESLRWLPLGGLVGGAAGAIAGALPQGTSYRDPVRSAARFLSGASRPLPERYLGWAGVMAPALVAELAGNGFQPERHFAGYFRVAAGRDPLPALLDVNLRTYLPDDLLVKADRTSMAASLEARSPFLDHELVELAAHIPPDLKLKPGLFGLGGADGSKHILKQALAGRLPPETIHRRKHGFGVPVGRWFRGHLRDYMTETLLSDRALRRGVIQAEAVKRLVADHLIGRRDNGHALWTLLTLEVWQQLYLDGAQIQIPNPKFQTPISSPAERGASSLQSSIPGDSI